MAETAYTVTARKDRSCQGYRCGRTIQAGEDYARHVAFPSPMSLVNQGSQPWVLCICRECQKPADMPMRLSNTRR